MNREMLNRGIRERNWHNHSPIAASAIGCRIFQATLGGGITALIEMAPSAESAAGLAAARPERHHA